MAFDARGWRKMVVGKAVYYWRLADQMDAPGYFSVRPERVPKNLLWVVGCFCSPPYDQPRHIKPGEVRKAIDSAVALGWPDERHRLILHAWTEIGPYLAAKSKWLSSTVVALATGIAAENAFDRLPILADALEEAGCDSAEVLRHCRGPGPHVRGCWVVDLLLSKS